MIQCKHKHLMRVTNIGIVTEWCMKHKKFVNDAICSGCSDKEGEITSPVSDALAFPRRSDKELDIIQNVCEGCPLFKAASQTCSKNPGLPLPTSTLAQHPSQHCPEDKW